MRVALIGVGNMGRPMAGRIAAAGHELALFDADAGRARQAASELHCRAAARLQELSSAEAVITMLPTGAAVRSVYLGSSDDGLASLLPPGTLAIDMSSSEPAGTRELGARLARRGITLLDAPVSGGVRGAQSGSLAIMIGSDDRAAIETARPLLAAMGQRLFETGALGSGHAMKALNNFCAAASYAATAEAMLIGRRFGLDPQRLVEILNASTGRSFVSEVVMKDHVLTGTFSTGFTLGLLAKDVRIAAELAGAVGLEAPVAQLVSARWALALDRLGAARDHSAAILGWGEDAAPADTAPTDTAAPADTATRADTSAPHARKSD